MNKKILEMSSLQNGNLCEYLKILSRDLGQFCFWFPRQNDYTGPLPMRQDLLLAWVYLEFFYLFTKSDNHSSCIMIPQVPWGTLNHQILLSYEYSTLWQYTWLIVNLMYSKGWTDTLGWFSYCGPQRKTCTNIIKIQFTTKYLTSTKKKKKHVCF